MTAIRARTVGEGASRNGLAAGRPYRWQGTPGWNPAAVQMPPPRSAVPLPQGREAYRDVTCPECGSGPGALCRSGTKRKPYTDSHLARRIAWQEATGAVPVPAPCDDDSACGTYAGYRRHTVRGQDPCQPCREAAARYKRQWRARAACGTYAGYKAHQNRHEEPCQPCRDAMAAYSRDWRKRAAR